jgi:tetratricopeptide (TPR) repeat protein
MISMKTIAFGLIIVVPLLIIYDIYGHLFVSWDDKENYLENAKILNGLTIPNLYWLITDCRLLGVWEPTSTFVKLSLVTLFHSSSKEMALSPSIFLLANLTMHICNSLLIFFKVLPSNESNIFVRLFATFIFAIHPQRVEPVAWASCLPYTLACFFSILSFVEYKNSSTNNNSRAWRRAVYLFLGMTSKIPAIGLLMVFLTETFLKRKQRNSIFIKKAKNNSNKRMFKEIFKVITETVKEHRYDISVSTVCVCLAYKANLVSESHNLSLSQRLGRASYSLFWYLYNTITLAEPNIIYAVETENMSIINLRYGFSFLLFLFCLGTSLLVVLNARNSSTQNDYKDKIMETLSMAFLMFVGIMLPSLQVIQHGYLTLGSDRYMYIPTAIVIAPFISKILHVTLFDINIYKIQRDNQNSVQSKALKHVDKRSNLPPSPRRSTATTTVGGRVVKKKLNRNVVVTSPSLWAVYTCMVAYLSISVATTAYNVQHWSDSVSLWSHAKYYIGNSTMINTEYSPVLSEITLNLAATYQENKEYETSHLFHLEALKLNNRSAHGYNNLVTLLVEMRKEGLLSKQFDSSAIKAAKKAIELDPTMSESMANLAMLYDYEENRWGAIEWYEKALKAAEEDVWKRKHSFTASKSKGTRVLNNPGFYLAYGNAIQATKKKGTLLTAYECYQRAYKLDPKFPLINEKMAKYQGDPRKLYLSLL